jgi:hypothetical protein
MTTNTAIACSLEPTAFGKRLNWISALNREHLRSVDRDRYALRLTYARVALPQVRELVDRERECCAFLEFDVTEAAEFVWLRIRAPHAEGVDPDALLEPFLLATEHAERAVRAPVRAPVRARDATCVGERCSCAEAAAAACGTQSGMSALDASPRRERHASRTGRVTTGVVVACVACCVAPLLLPAIAMPAIAMTAFTGALAAFLRDYRGGIEVALAGGVAGWLWVGWRHVRTRRPR